MIDPLASFVLVALGLEREEVPRYRDAYVDPSTEPPTLVVFTRVGGGNREEYREEIERMRARPGFLGDWDDPFDGAYAHFRYAAPEGARMDLIVGSMREAGWTFASPMERARRAVEESR